MDNSAKNITSLEFYQQKIDLSGFGSKISNILV